MEYVSNPFCFANITHKIVQKHTMHIVPTAMSSKRFFVESPADKCRTHSMVSLCRTLCQMPNPSSEPRHQEVIVH